MGKSTNYITHPGIVQKVEIDRVFVMILAESACVSCKVKGMCSVADMKEKIIEAYRQPGKEYKAGQKVNVILQRTMGTKAVILGYLIPFVIVVVALFSLTGTGLNQGGAALISLGLLLPYYLTLYRFKDTFKKRFSFRVE